MLLLGRACGLVTAESRVVAAGGRDVLLVRRFDRERTGGSYARARMVSDDHPRNHAVIARDTDWALSPAYDLTPSTPISLERRDLAMECGDAGRMASAANLMTQHARFLLSEDEAHAIVDTMERQVRATWYATARSAGVSERDCDRIAGAFAYPGFDEAAVAQ